MKKTFSRICLRCLKKEKKNQERLTCKEKNELIFTKKKHFRFSLINMKMNSR